MLRGQTKSSMSAAKPEGLRVVLDTNLPDVLGWVYTGNRLHPTQKPVPSLKPVIEAFTRRGDIVLDPFCGSGSTLLAAKILGRRYIGIELDAEHSKTAERRLS